MTTTEIEWQGDISYLYAFSCDGFHKVGITRDLKRRLASIQAMNPHPIRLALYRRVHADWTRRYEIIMHRLLREHHVHGEWFSADLRTIKKACKEGMKELEAIAQAHEEFLIRNEAEQAEKQAKRLAA